MDRLDDLRLFTCVAETRSFTRAAERMGLSKSAASRRIAELEARLGARLFHRTTRSISLTQVGQGFHERVSQILADLEEAEGLVASQHAAPRGVLKLAAPMSFGLLHLGPAICAFQERFPEVQVDVDLSDRFVDLVDEGYDLAVRIGRLKDSSLIARRICPARRVAVASPAYLHRRGEPATPDALAEHDCLHYSNASVADHWSFRAAPGSEMLRPARPAITMRANNGDILRTAAVAGRGIAVLPTFIVGDDLAAGRLRTVLLDWTMSPSALHAVYPANRHLSPKVRAFVDFIAARFGPEPPWDTALPAVPGG